MKHEIKKGITNELRLDLTEWGLGVTNATVDAEITAADGVLIHAWTNLPIVDYIVTLDTTPDINRAFPVGLYKFEARISYADGSVRMLINRGLIRVTD